VGALALVWTSRMAARQRRRAELDPQRTASQLRRPRRA
jgi:hypothetical protein